MELSIFLVIVFFIIFYIIYKNIRDNKKTINDLKEQLTSIKKEKQFLTKEKYELNKNLVELKKEIDFLKEGLNKKDEYFNYLKTQDNESIIKITSLYSDFMLIQYSITSRYLKLKSHPAKKEATRINDFRIQSKIHLEQYRHMMYKYEMLIQLFPELTNYVDDFDTIKQLDDLNNLDTIKEEFDRVQLYISKEEYRKLNLNQRNQLALERYIIGQKSKWQIGRDYELYCGQLYEKENWKVEYIGMEKKLQDMGRDLIAIKGNNHQIIQCKYWAKEKLIHEKHITQLFGTSIVYGMDKPKEVKVIPTLITNIQVSESARKFAEKLEVIIKENIPIAEFPRIKCNVGRDENGHPTYIYHLPFDQQYDRTKINQEEEFYAFSVEEATNKGFRRAFKYFG